MTLQQLLSGLPPELILSASGGDAISIHHIRTDARAVSPGDLFCAYRGTAFDGHRSIPSAIEAGAACILLEDPAALPLCGNLPHVLCRAVRPVLSYLYCMAYGSPQKALRLCGITGTNGKTSVSTLLAAVLRDAGRKTALFGTVSNSIGPDSVPSSLTTPGPEQLAQLLRDTVSSGGQDAVMEVSSHALALCRTDALHFALGVFTNLTPEHLDFHGTLSAYFAAKRKLFMQSELCLANVESPYTARFRTDTSLSNRLFFYGPAGAFPAPDFFSMDVVFRGADGVSFSFCTRGGAVPVCSPLLGDFAVSNLTAALSAAVLLGLDAEQAAAALGRVRSIPGRMERVPLPLHFPVLIDYAHTPDALQHALISSRRFVGRGGRLFVLFGCGGDRDRAKRPEMGRIAARYADFTVVTGDNSRTENPDAILADILAGMPADSKSRIVIKDRTEAIAAALSRARAGDVLLLCGKGHETYEITKEGRRPFSEKEVLRRLTGAEPSEMTHSASSKQGSCEK